AVAAARTCARRHRGRQRARGGPGARTAASPQAAFHRDTAGRRAPSLHHAARQRHFADPGYGLVEPERRPALAPGSRPRHRRRRGRGGADQAALRVTHQGGIRVLAVAVRVSILLITAALLLNGVRLVRGPSAVDRVLALDTFYINSIA